MKEWPRLQDGKMQDYNGGRDFNSLKREVTGRSCEKLTAGQMPVSCFCSPFLMLFSIFSYKHLKNTCLDIVLILHFWCCLSFSVVLSFADSLRIEGFTMCLGQVEKRLDPRPACSLESKECQNRDGSSITGNSQEIRRRRFDLSRCFPFVTSSLRWLFFWQNQDACKPEERDKTVTTLSRCSFSHVTTCHDVSRLAFNEK